MYTQYKNVPPRVNPMGGYKPTYLLLILIIKLNNIIIYHDFLPTPRKGSHVKSDKTHTGIKIHPLAHILDT